MATKKSAAVHAWMITSEPEARYAPPEAGGEGFRQHARKVVPPSGMLTIVIKLLPTSATIRPPQSLFAPTLSIG